MSQLAFGNAFGFTGKDFALLAVDCCVPRSIVVMKSNDDKILKISDKTMFALIGDVGDRKNFGEYILRNIKWYQMRNGKSLTNKEIANYTRNTLAYSIRNNPYLTWIIQAGFDDKVGPSLYWMDYFGSLATVNTAAAGLAQYFLLRYIIIILYSFIIAQGLYNQYKHDIIYYIIL